MNWSSALLLTIAVVVVVGNRDALAAPTKARDLALYDLAGPFALDTSPRRAEDQATSRAMIREFLWTRWERRRLAHVAVVEYSVEGLPTRTWYFIEPDERGSWRIVLEQDKTLAALKRDSDEHLRETHHYHAYRVERVALPSTDDASRSATREDDSYRLKLIDQHGRLIQTL